VIVAHSMGGLVSRAILLNANAVEAIDLSKLIRGIVSLGTPHDGTLTSVTYTQRLMKAILRHAEWAAKVPLRRAVSRGSNVVTARELAKQDGEKVIETLNARATRAFRTISISGGWEYRYVDENFLKVLVQAVLNLLVKAQLPTPHDGLVPEISSDITRVLTKRIEAVSHLGKSGYANWQEINHSDLVVDQVVFGAVNDGLKRL
jgi:pimeloyl-ACP methyl ester carboxylesterase